MTASRILLRLSEDGIITRNRGHGWRFESTLNTKAAHDDSYAFRMVIEPAAIRSPGFELDAGLADLCRHLHETALKPGLEAPSFSTLVNIDATFHRLIGVSSRNRFVRSAIERQNSLRRALEYATWNKARMFDSCLEHMGILDALERGEREKAADLMFHHLAVAHDLTTWTELGDDG